MLQLQITKSKIILIYQSIVSQTALIFLKIIASIQIQQKDQSPNVKSSSSFSQLSSQTAVIF